MTKPLNTTLRWLWISLCCVGCATQQPLRLPDESPSMIEIFERFQPTSEVEVTSMLAANTPAEANRPEFMHRRNPTIHVFVYPRTADVDGLSTPGYWTSFKLLEPNSRQSDQGNE